MSSTPTDQPSNDSDFVVLHLPPAEAEAVRQAAWHYIRFLRRFKYPTPIQQTTIHLLLTFVQRLPTKEEK